MKYKVFLMNFFLSSSIFATTLLNQIVENTNIAEFNIENLEGELSLIKGNSMMDIIRRSELESEISRQKELKAKFLLDQSIKNTDIGAFENKAEQEVSRFQRRNVDLGSDKLNNVVDRTIENSNPAIAAKSLTPQGRPLIIGQDVDIENLFFAKGASANEKIVVYRTTDLRGRVVYKNLDGNTVDNIVLGKVFNKSDIIFRNESGEFAKGFPKAIFADGTLEFRDQYGMTQRRAIGSYHLSDDFLSARGQSVTTHSGESLSVYDSVDNNKSLSEREKKALKALQKIMCNL